MRQEPPPNLPNPANNAALPSEQTTSTNEAVQSTASAQGQSGTPVFAANAAAGGSSPPTSSPAVNTNFRTASEQQIFEAVTQYKEREVDFQDATPHELLDFVLRKIPHPTDHYAIASVLETYGLRDIDVQARFGKPNIFVFSKDLYELYITIPDSVLFEFVPDLTQQVFDEMREAATLYLKGLSSSIPWALQALCLSLFGYAFGISASFTQAEAFAAGAGMALSLVVTGGFVQTIGRLASFYVGQYNYVLTQRLYYQVVSIGALLTMLIGIVLFSASRFVPRLPFELVAMSAAYYVLFSMMALSLSIFHILHRFRALAGVTLLGIAVMVLMNEVVHSGLAIAHLTGICTTNLAAIVWIHLHLQREQTTQPLHQSQSLVTPRLSVLAYSIAPYFAGGVLYFALLFADRIVNWTAVPRSLARTTPLVVHSGYEIGMIWAFVAFVFITPLLEYVSHRFLKAIIPAQQRYTALDRERHNLFFLKIYGRLALLLIAFAMLCVTFTYWGVMAMQYWHIDLFRGIISVALEETQAVFWLGAAGYSLLALALLNNLMLLSLARPRFVVRALGWAMLTNVCVGMLASRLYGSWYSAAGMTAGACMLALLSGWSVVRVLRKMDFYYYSSF